MGAEVVAVVRNPRSFLRGAFLAWHRSADIAFDDAPTPPSLFPQQRLPESELSDEELQQELPQKLLTFYKRCRRSVAFERQLFFALRHGKADTAQVALDALKDAENNGLRYVLNRASEAGRALGSRARQVRVEFHRLKGLIRFVPVTVGDEELLVGRAETSHHVADLLVLYFRERFVPSSACPDCATPGERRADHPQLSAAAGAKSEGVTRIVLLVGDRAYISGDAGEVLTDAAGPYRQALADDDFERFWLAYYRSQAIPQRTNTRLRQQRLPKKYWSWVLEAARFASDGS